MRNSNGQTGAAQCLNGLWLAYLRGLPLMTHNYSNILYPTREAAEQALAVGDCHRAP